MNKGCIYSLQWDAGDSTLWFNGKWSGVWGGFLLGFNENVINV